jgi:uridine kinase
MILQRPSPAQLRVGIDGIDCAGKSRLAEELETLLKSRVGKLARMSVDDFLHSPSKRYEKGDFSPEGYYRDSFDYEAARMAIEAHASDRLLLFEGIFLFRPELNSLWDFRIFVDISFETSLARALHRDGLRFGDVQTTREKYERRYLPGQRIYFSEAHPRSLADVILHNDDLDNVTLSFTAPKTSPRASP